MFAQFLADCTAALGASDAQRLSSLLSAYVEPADLAGICAELQMLGADRVSKMIEKQVPPNYQGLVKAYTNYLQAPEEQLHRSFGSVLTQVSESPFATC
jgi:hypothetical protein